MVPMFILFFAIMLAGMSMLLAEIHRSRRFMDYSANHAINHHAQSISATLHLTTPRRLPGLVQLDLIASMTTTYGRMANVNLAIESILLQSARPASVHLYISNAIGNEDLPTPLMNLEAYGVHVHFVEDIGPHTKLIYALRDFPGYKIITADDDFLHPINSFETLLRTSEIAPDAIVGNWVRKLRTDRAGRMKKARSGKIVTPKSQVRELDRPPSILKVDHAFFAYGTSGILYPPDCLDQRVFDIDLMRQLCPTEDDVWFKAMSLLNDRPVAATNLGHSPKHHVLAGSQSVALRHVNYAGGGERTANQIATTFDYFDLHDRLTRLRRNAGWAG